MVVTAKWTVQDVIQVMDEYAPPALAFDGDPIGLQVGRADKPVKRVMLALDPSPDVIDRAIKHGCDLIVTHHAMIYRPLKRIDTATKRGRALAQALAHDIAVFSAHTNLDVAEGGVNDALATRLSLDNVEVLDRLHNEALRKLVVFVPKTHHEVVMQAICAAGAGHIGNYSHCTFNTPGEGTFLAETGAQPFLGKMGVIERADEIRLETIVPHRLVETVVRAMLAVHPYEEVAYDVYQLELMGKGYGIGRIGDLDEAMTLQAFAVLVRDRLGLEHIRFSGDPGHFVSRVAVLGGSGGKWAAHSIRRGADVLVTADCDHHTVAEAWQDGLAMIDATHAALELPVLENVAARLRSAFRATLDILVTDFVEDPFYWL